jgi:hypothetical protein
VLTKRNFYCQLRIKNIRPYTRTVGTGRPPSEVSYGGQATCPYNADALSVYFFIDNFFISIYIVVSLIFLSTEGVMDKLTLTTETIECLMYKEEMPFWGKRGLSWVVISALDPILWHVQVRFPVGTEMVSGQTKSGYGLSLFALPEGHFCRLRHPTATRPVRTLEYVIPYQFKDTFASPLPPPFGK